MATTTHRGIDIGAPLGAHLHTGNATHIGSPNPFKELYGPHDTEIVISSASSFPIRLQAESIAYDVASVAGAFGARLAVRLSAEEMIRLTGGGAETVQFMRDQIDVYDDEFSKDFVSGFKTAIEVLMGTKSLEDYLPEDK